MKRWIGWLLAFLLAVLGSAAAWVFFAGGSGDPSTDLTTPPIADSTSTTESRDGESTPSVPGETTTTGLEGEGTVYVIDATRTTATYEIDEILNGRDNRVVGQTQQVAGQFVVDPSGAVRFSPILINARTFVTDSSNRDRLVRGPVILNSAEDEFEFITFEVVSLPGLQNEVEVGETVVLTAIGDLTIKGVTRRTTFDLSVTLVDEDTISGEAVAMVSRSDFGIGIPSVPSVAGVDDAVTIRLEFVAVAS